MSTTTTNERPILFSGEMVRAILAGRKTQTRRVIKCKGTWHVGNEQTGGLWPWFENDLGECQLLPCPFGKPGDELWVRETWGVASIYDGLPPRDIPRCKVAYSASGGVAGVKCRPSIHMPRWASRISLRITDVRVERLNDISEADAIAEGCQCAGVPASVTNVGAFAKLWESIHGDGSWSENPWVWVVEFERVKQ